jgi:UDP-N-acetylglucosamine 2-epimerase
MAPSDFLRLVFNSRAIVGNSSMAVRECSYLGVPAVNIGSRQGGRERGANVVDVGHERNAIFRAISTVGRRSTPGSDLTYGDAKAGPRVADLLAGADLRSDKKLAY